MTATEILSDVQSWKLERISRTTYPRDIIVKLGVLSKPEIQSISDAIKHGICYRCRIAKNRWYFGATPEDAARFAVAGQKK